MSTPSNDFDALFKAIPKRIEERLSEFGPRGSSSQWTNAVRSALDDLARQEKLDCRHSPLRGATIANWEFLCDVMWLKTGAGPHREPSGYFSFQPGDQIRDFRIRRCVLACEIEWGLGRLRDLIYDFSKLLLIRSDYILFIAEARDDDDRDDIVKALRAAWAALDHKIPADRIMVLIHKYERENPTTLLEVCPLVGP